MALGVPQAFGRVIFDDGFIRIQDQSGNPLGLSCFLELQAWGGDDVNITVK